LPRGKLTARSNLRSSRAALFSKKNKRGDGQCDSVSLKTKQGGKKGNNAQGKRRRLTIRKHFFVGGSPS